VKAVSRRILVTGAAGQVGFELTRALEPLGEVVPLTRDALDVCDSAAIDRTLELLRPHVVVNAAAYTAVDRAEAERELCFRVNGDAPGRLAAASRRMGALFVHYSTDYVFDGAKRSPYLETDSTSPLNVYGASKLAGEQAVATAGGRFLVLRTSWIFGARGRNFLATIQRRAAAGEPLRIADDQVGAPTSSAELADATRTIVAQALDVKDDSDGTWGVYHVTAQGSTTWYGFALRILRNDPGLQQQRGGVSSVTPIPSSEYPTPARRPGYSVLDNMKLLDRFGVQLPHWEQQLDHVLTGNAG
jgi:dTDP-4-dehydrorhamnose reductase